MLIFVTEINVEEIITFGTTLAITNLKTEVEAEPKKRSLIVDMSGDSECPSNVTVM
jgi:hypothetical protein